MVQSNESKSHAKKNNKSPENEYKLKLSSQLIDSLKKFCKKMEMTEDGLINLLLKMHLEEIESGINIRNYELIIVHYNFSYLLEDKEKIENKIINEEIKQEITVKIKRENEKAIVEMCTVIRKIDPIKFIEDAIKYQFNAIIDNLRKGHYEFLAEFQCFSEMIKQFKLLRKRLVDDERD